MARIFLLVLAAEIFNTAGQILFKKGTNDLEPPAAKSLSSYLSFAQKILAMPATWLGFGAMGLGLLIWLLALAHADLSIVFPLGSLQYILILFAARFFLAERIDSQRIIGTLLVAAGIGIIAFGA